MIAIFQIILPVFLLIALGYGLGRVGLVTAEQARALGRFVIVLALPALLFNTLATRRIAEVLHFDYLAVCGLGSVGAFAIGYGLFRGPLHQSRAKSGIRAMGMSFSNTGFIGLPIALQLFGAFAAVPLALNVLIENLVMLPLTLSFIHMTEGSAGGANLRGMLRNLFTTPMVQAIIAGAAVSLAGVTVPAALGKAIGLLAGASAPAALIAIGAGLVGVKVHEGIGAVSLITFGKLIIHPALVALLTLVIPVAEPRLAFTVLLFAAMPMLSIFPIMAQQVDDQEICSSALLITTVLSILTVSLLLWARGITPMT